MIYLVTNNKELFKNDLYKIIGVDESLHLLSSLEVVGLDTETSGLDCHEDKLLSLQLGCFDFQIVIDCTTVNILNYKEFLESNRLFLLWNAKFDLKWLYRYGIVPKKVYDGYLAEKLMWLGYPAGIHSLGLKAAGKNYLNIELDKSIRGQIIYRGLISSVIEYAALDVKYLEKIKEAQAIKLREKDLFEALEYENRFVRVLAYIEYCGVRLDVPKWKTKMKKDEEKLKEAQDKLNKWVKTHFPQDSRFCKIDLQGDLFEGFNSEPQSIINWNSSKQVIPLFKLLGFELKVKDKATGKMKESIEAKVIEPQQNKSDIAPLYLEFKGIQKIVSTYGQNFLDQVNSNTGRIYTNFNQLTDTGRLSCGGKDGKKEYVNLQNLPADSETRSCFIAEEGNVWISLDYQGQESRLIASIADDKAMIDLFNNGCGDVHSLTAKMAYPDKVGDCPVEEIKHKFKHWRQEAKGVEFSINYGGDANTIASNKGISLVEAQKIYSDYMKGFNGIRKYQDFCRKDVMEKGYILLNPYSRHKAYIYDYDELMAIKKKFNPEFWEYYRQMKKEAPDCETVQQVKHYFERKAASEKQSINYRIQGTGALTFKLASIYFFNYLEKNNLLFKVLYCIPVHDEINIEAPKEIGEEIAKILATCMEEAGDFFCRKVKLGVDISRLDNGELPTYWIH